MLCQGPERNEQVVNQIYQELLDLVNESTEGRVDLTDLNNSRETWIYHGGRDELRVKLKEVAELIHQIDIFEGF